jgi:hypothetical protein
MLGTDGRESCPTAGMNTCASYTAPVLVSTRHRRRSSSNAALVTSVLNRMCGVIPYLSAVAFM